MKFSLSTRTVPALSPRERIRLCAETGYDALCLDGAFLPWDSSRRSAEEVRAAATEARIEIAAYDPGLGRFAESNDASAILEKVRAAAELAKAMNCRRLVLHVSARPSQPRELLSRMKEEAQRIRELIDALSGESLDVCLPIEPGTLAHDHFAAVGLLQWVDRFDAQLVFDAAELYAARADFTDRALRSVEDRLGVFLLRDFRFGDSGPVAEPLTKGIMDWLPHLQRLAQIHFDGPVVLGSHLPVGAGEDVRKAICAELATARALLEHATKG
jgi:sugar phosphate isomerase/epimerase